MKNLIAAAVNTYRGLNCAFNNAGVLPPTVTLVEMDESIIDQVVSALGDLEAKLQEQFNRFLDTLAAHEVELNFKYVIQFSLHRRLAYASHPPVKSAILATDSTIIHYGRLHAVLTQGSPINVRIFQDRKEAAKWLKVPVERLSAEAKGSS